MMKHALAGVLILTFGGLLGGCDTRRTSASKKENQAVQIYDLESKCAKDAKDYFSANWRTDDTTAGLDYTNHYNRALNKCFVLVRRQTFINPKEEWNRDVTLADVHERVNYGEFLENHAGTSTRLAACAVGGASCAAEQDFETRIKPYMTD